MKCQLLKQFFLIRSLQRLNVGEEFLFSKVFSNGKAKHGIWLICRRKPRIDCRVKSLTGDFSNASKIPRSIKEPQTGAQLLQNTCLFAIFLGIFLIFVILPFNLLLIYRKSFKISADFRFAISSCG